MNVVLWIFAILSFLIIIYAGVGTAVAIILTKVGPHPQYDKTPETYGVQYQEVKIHSREDRLRLSAWYLPNKGAERAIILVHGRNASKQNAISGKLPELASRLRQTGLAVLMLDLRGHGGSEGKRYTWGVYERRDVLGAVDFMLGEGFTLGKIAVLGISLGGAAAVGAAYEEPAIGALVLDSTFADLEALVEPNWRKESGLPMFFLPAAFLMWRLLFRFDLKNVKPGEELAEMLPRPVLVLHSQTDESVPVANGIQLSESAHEGNLVLFEDCDHAELFRDAPEKYLEALLPFVVSF